MVTKIASDEPPAAHLCSAHEAPVVATAGEHCATVKACGIHTTDGLCVADKAPSFGPARELTAKKACRASCFSFLFSAYVERACIMFQFSIFVQRACITFREFEL
ncbi:hypothetical protein ACQJBY_048233 [Aegilops geniculata]